MGRDPLTWRDAMGKEKNIGQVATLCFSLARWSWRIDMCLRVCRPLALTVDGP
jgi:hypothetical protein